MATAYPKAGKDGSVTGTGAGAKIRAWEATIEIELHDVSNFDGNGWKEFVQGLKSATGSLRAVGDAATFSATISDLVLSEGTGGVQLSGAAVASNVRYNVDIGGEIGHECDFTFTGSVVVSEVA